MFLVVFRNRKRAGIDGAAYEADAARMEALARARPGFLSFKSWALPITPSPKRLRRHSLLP